MKHIFLFGHSTGHHTVIPSNLLRLERRIGAVVIEFGYYHTVSSHNIEMNPRTCGAEGSFQLKKGHLMAQR